MWNRGAKRASLVREKLRLAGRLKLSLRKLTGMENAHIEDFLIPELFDACVNGVKENAEITTQNSLSGTKVFARPSSALKIGQLLKKLASLKRGQEIRNRNSISKEKNSWIYWTILNGLERNIVALLTRIWKIWNSTSKPFSLWLEILRNWR